MVKIQFPDGQCKEFVRGTTVAEVAQSISASLGKLAVAGKLNGGLVDLDFKLSDDAQLVVISIDSQEGLEIMRHTTAHVLAQAVKRLFADVKLGIGPVIEDGFYYDLNLERSLTPEDLLTIEKEMLKIVKEDMEIKRLGVTLEEARRLFKNQPYKLEILDDLTSDQNISVYQQGEFMDLCRGPHLRSTGKIKAFKLAKVSGAYWRGDKENDVLQRVYGVAFHKDTDLKNHFHILVEAAKRDHRKLGKQLELFMFSEEAPGMPFYLPKGQIIRNELERFARELQESASYEEVRTPFMLNQKLWEKSGHWDHYKENMYFTEVDEKSYALKPMNCPGHMLIFKNKLHSYRDLPVRMAEFGQVHRHEYSGALNGMLRVRTFCQDDAHIFVREDQIESEIKQIFQLVDKVYQTFGFDYSVELSTRPEDSLGDDMLWEHAESALTNVLNDLGMAYHLNIGDGAFYGPKIDFHIKDALKRSHQCATIQLDFQMPEKFDLHYVNEQGEKQRPVVIHRAVFGSIDRFFGILVEHFGGAFPVWLAPVQVEIIPVSDVHIDYCKMVKSLLSKDGVRVEINRSSEKIGYKIRAAQLQKVPCVLVVGDREVANRCVNLRRYGQKDSELVAVDSFKEQIVNEIIQKLI
ncbi:threonine--tRNA ligase [Sutcliffiella rhizosphaerae]|uniref:Threonine--tRNA ligase n=1 Tax=Sutcliffiella rhizosphaerae TaxID=2880967 RepID=A0ABM8YMC1_9BACI|nr:threonine--tRNA ligase [Sutcliffiella rhizosphaerae]CAG9621114.1 Threonine--tRNA ligase 2 [Sutcliffiella rhizosphaerae]